MTVLDSSPRCTVFTQRRPQRIKAGAAEGARCRRRARRVLLRILGLMTMTILWQPVHASVDEPIRFKRISTQFIAALGDPKARSGDGAQTWGLWRKDPGPRGVWLRDHEKLRAAGGVAPARWTFDADDWWVEENGLIMEQPDFPVPPGRYLVTGGRDVTTVLTVHPTGTDGERRWELHDGATLYDVTHLPCRSARYTPASGSGSCSPASADRSQWPVTPGATMPVIGGCHKQDYAVLFVIGIAGAD